jgi:hypothetical protein
LFVVNYEALAMGYILWVHLYDIGQTAQKNKVGPYSVYHILACREGLPDNKAGYVNWGVSVEKTWKVLIAFGDHCDLEGFWARCIL